MRPRENIIKPVLKMYYINFMCRCFLKSRSYLIKIFTRSEKQQQRHQTNSDNVGKRKYNKTGSQNVPYDFLVQVFCDGRISNNMILK